MVLSLGQILAQHPRAELKILWEFPGRNFQLEELIMEQTENQDGLGKRKSLDAPGKKKI